MKDNPTELKPHTLKDNADRNGLECETLSLRQKFIKLRILIQTLMCHEQFAAFALQQLTTLYANNPQRAMNYRRNVFFLSTLNSRPTLNYQATYFSPEKLNTESEEINQTMMDLLDPETKHTQHIHVSISAW